MEKCGTKPKTDQRAVGRSGVTTAGNGGRSDPQNVELAVNPCVGLNRRDGQAWGLVMVTPC
jgi:hypothetical protein